MKKVLCFQSVIIEVDPSDNDGKPLKRIECQSEVAYVVIPSEGRRFYVCSLCALVFANCEAFWRKKGISFYDIRALDGRPLFVNYG